MRQLVRRDLSPIALEDPGLRLGHLAQRPEGDSLPVWEGTALPPGDEVRFLVDDPRELVDEAGLADTWHADERHELRLALGAGTRERIDEQIELALAADERRLDVRG